MSDKANQKVFRVRYTHEILVQSGSEDAVREAARALGDQVLPHAIVANPSLLTQSVEVVEGVETNVRIKMEATPTGQKVPTFYTLPTIVESYEELAKYKPIRAGENVKVKGSTKEYLYQPNARPNPNLDVRYTVTSSHGGLWIDTGYLREQLVKQYQQQST